MAACTVVKPPEAQATVCGLKHFYGEIFALDSAVVQTQICLAHMDASLLIQCITTGKHSNQFTVLPTKSDSDVTVCLQSY